MKRLEHGSKALAQYGGDDKFISHVRIAISSAARGDPYEFDEQVTRSAPAVRLDDVKEASQELQRREIEARLRRQRRNLWLFVGAVFIAAGVVALWLAR
jgi:hypothetical protein